MNYKLTLLFLLACATANAQKNPCVNSLANDEIRVRNVSVQDNGRDLMLSLDLNLDSLRLPTNTRLVYTPVVKSGNKQVSMPEIVINGRRQQVMYDRGVDNDKFSDRAYIVRRKNNTEQTVHYQGAVPFEKWMKNYDVTMHEDLCGCGDSLDGRDITLRRKRQPVMAYVSPKAEAEKIRQIDKRAYIDFPVDKITLYPDYRRNPAQLDSIINTINIVKNDRNIEIKEINIHGFASPESPYEHNDYLAENRAKTLKDYVRRLVQLPESIFTVSHTAEDWDGLRAYLKESNLEHKAEILAISNDERLDLDAREWKIKSTYADEYKFMLASWYPALRHSDYHVKYSVRPFSVEEAKPIIKTKPQQLSLNEMFLVAQTYEPGSHDFNEVMETAVRMFPDDPTANLNAACTRLNAGDAAGAAPYLAKAGSSAEAVHARGISALLEGNNDEARTLLRQAAAAGVESAAENLQNLE